MIKNYNNVRVRVQEKQALILNWMIEEGFSHHTIMQGLLDLGRRQTDRTLKHFERKGLLKKKVIEIGSDDRRSRPFPIWLATSQGKYLADTNLDYNIYNSQHISIGSLFHSLDIQEVRLKARGHYENWKSCRQMNRTNLVEFVKIPDALANDKHRKVVAFEIERTIKSRKIYQVIIGEYLQMIKAGLIDYVYYICPTEKSALNLKKKFEGIKHTEIKNQRIKLSKHHYDYFLFCGLDCFPNDGKNLNDLKNIQGTADQGKRMGRTELERLAKGMDRKELERLAIERLLTGI